MSIVARNKVSAINLVDSQIPWVESEIERCADELRSCDDSDLARYVSIYKGLQIDLSFYKSVSGILNEELSLEKLTSRLFMLSDSYDEFYAENIESYLTLIVATLMNDL